MTDEHAPKDSLVFLCECGPIIRDLLDLDALETEVTAMAGVARVVRHTTLCSAEGKAFLAEKMRENPDLLPVVAACTPREHAADFADACEAAGRNPFTMSRANIREQVAWVTPDRDEATAKAADVTAAAVARVGEQEPLTAPELDAETDVLVVGSGVAGMTAALLIADAGRKVTLVEREPAIGGKVVLLSEVYPDMDCAPCLLEPLMDKVLHHPQIEAMTSAEVDEVLGYLGNFTVTVRKHARHVDADGCYGCIETCSGVCPVSVPDSYNVGMTERHAVHIPYAGAMPNAAVVDEKSCLHFNGGDCVACVDACPFGVIELDGGDELVERHVGAIVLATGSQLALDESGPWALPGVMTTWEFERVINPDGPTSGEIRLPDGAVPKRIAFVHCADANGAAPTDACSKTCCLAMAKQIVEAAHKLPETEIVELAFDRQLGGPHFVHAQAAGEVPANLRAVRLEAGDHVDVEAAENGAVTVTATAGERTLRGDFDLVVMAPPHVGDASAVAAAKGMGCDVDESGYVLVANGQLASAASRIEGIYVAGSAQGEKCVSDSTSQAGAAAGGVLSALVPGKKLVREATTAIVNDSLCGGCRICTLSCPYKAITFDEAQAIAVVNELLCQGCGTCASACPSSAISARHFTDDQILAEIHALSSKDHAAIMS